jgi:DNA-directed RNA polymerase I, II, and III subunit RPABC2
MDLDNDDQVSVDEEVEVLDVEEEIDPETSFALEEEGDDDPGSVDDDSLTEKPAPLSKRFDVVSINEMYGSSLDQTKKTRPYLTQFEITKILAVRAQQLENGSPPFIALTDELHNSKAIAFEEYRSKNIPFVIRRYLPDKSHEDWRLSDFRNAFVI